MQWTAGWRCGIAGALLLAGCAPAPPAAVRQPAATGNASWRAVEAPDVGRYQLSPGQVAMGATAARHEDPLYPAAQLDACPPPVEITALLIVNTAGEVHAVRVLAASTPAGVAAPFVAATRTAALRWQFAPLMIADWVTDAAGNRHRVASAVRPFSVAYVFRFACHAGQGAVSTLADPAAGRRASGR